MGFLADIADATGFADLWHGFTGRDVDIENRDAQLRENEITRQREDNAIQRRVADLTSAGLSPTLAAGSAADSKNLTAPTMQTSNSPMNIKNFGATLDSLSAMANIAQGIANIQKTQAEQKNVEADTSNKLSYGQFMPDVWTSTSNLNNARSGKLGIENQYLGDYLASRNAMALSDKNYRDLYNSAQIYGMNARARESSTHADLMNTNIAFNNRTFENRVLAEQLRTQLLNGELLTNTIDNMHYMKSGLNPKYGYGAIGGLAKTFAGPATTLMEGYKQSLGKIYQSLGWDWLLKK